MTEQQKEQIVFNSIKNFNSPCHLKSLLISNPFEGGFLGNLFHIELATFSDGHTHIGVKDVFEIIDGEKSYLRNFNNRLLKSILTHIDALVNSGKINFNPIKYTDQNSLTYTDVGMLDDDAQKLYSKYIEGYFQ